MDEKAVLLDTILAALNWSGAAADVFMGNQEFLDVLSDIKDGRIKLVRDEMQKPKADISLDAKYLIEDLQSAGSWTGYGVDWRVSEPAWEAMQRLESGETVIISATEIAAKDRDAILYYANKVMPSGWEGMSIEENLAADEAFKRLENGETTIVSRSK